MKRNKKKQTSKIKPVSSFMAFVFVTLCLSYLLWMPLGICSVESSLHNIQSKLMTVILPLASILGLIFAGLSFVAGSMNARSHLVLAIIGAVVGFGSPSIVSFIRVLVN